MAGAGETKPKPTGAACPHLGLEDDAFNRLGEPSPRHRCYLWMQRDRIDVAHQASFCLSPAHATCPWLSISTPAAVKPGADEGAVARLAGLLGAAALRLGSWLLQLLVAAGRVSARAAVAAWCWLRPNAARFVRFLLAQVARGLRALGRASVSALRSVWAALRSAGRAAPAVATEMPVPSDAQPEAAAPSSEVPVSELVEQGVLALRQGGREVAYGLFVQASQREDAVEEAWLWRGVLAKSVEEKRACLEQVLRINPDSARARAALAQLGATASEPAATAAPVLSAAPVADPRASPIVGAGASPLPPVRPLPATWQCDVCLNSNPSSSQVCRTCGSPSPAVEAQMKGTGDALLEEGIAALKIGNEEAAHHLFVAACEASPQSELAWYWRAKTADTVDEVVSSLEQALAINPSNAKIQADLDWARQRQEREQALVAATAPQEAPAPPRGPTAAQRLGRALRGLMPQVAGLAAFVLCLFWLSPAVLARAAQVVPPELFPMDALARDARPYVPELALPPLPFESPWPWLPSFDFAPAIPYVVVAMYFYAAYLLVDRRPKSRFWGPAVGVLGILLGFACIPNMAALIITAALCTVVIMAAIIGWRELAGDQEVQREVQRRDVSASGAR